MTRVIFLGTPHPSQIKAYNAVLTAQKLALNKLKANISASLPDKIAREYIKSQGYPLYPHGLGHGIGLAIHEAPRLRTDSREKLQKNMVFTIEPGIYIQGKFGIRLEDLVLLKDDGIELLSKSPKTIESIIIK